jgi:hypothetical protein
MYTFLEANLCDNILMTVAQVGPGCNIPIYVHLAFVSPEPKELSYVFHSEIFSTVHVLYSTPHHSTFQTISQVSIFLVTKNKNKLLLTCLCFLSSF